ncbi:hypothetical protein LR004_01490 [Candidatus Gracilibacteria bacterium]|nr:hypothetical protein [Candidatus Gracilibacteria bacterium]
MSKKITIEIDESYGEKLDILRKVFVGPEGKELTDNGELVQGLMDTFIEFLQNQPNGEDDHVHGEHCNH